jgi:23S rRNA (uridine2552-2'-O)-methyltransferase
MKRLDQQKSINICNKILIFALNVLQKHGSFCVKIFQGKDFLDYINLCKKKFLKVKINKPKGSRIESMEIYIICINKKN